MNTVPLLGLEFADLNVTEAAQWITQRAQDGPFGYIVTPNADHLVRLARQPELGAHYRNAALRLLDSRVIALAARALGLNAPREVPGSDLTHELLHHHLNPGERVTIVGLAPALMPGLMARCKLAEPAHYNPPMGFEHNEAELAKAAAFVAAHPARFIFLAVGSPRQEILAARIAAERKARGTGLCIGASLEFVAGVRRRAPYLMRRGGLEWLHRLAAEPHRLTRRYLIDCPAILPMLLRERMEAGVVVQTAHSAPATISATRS